MNLSKTILRPDGEEAAMAYPSPKIIKGLPGFAEGNLDSTFLPKETVRSVIFNCLNFSAPETLEDSYTVNLIGKEMVKAEDNITLRPALHTALVELLKKQILTEIKDKEGNITGQRGSYKGWAIVQVLEEMGEKPKPE
jgi:hypothetical protein